MSIYLYNLPALSLGHNNTAQLSHLHWLNNELFSDYYNYIETTYQPYESLVMSAARRQKPMGLPSATWRFDSLSVKQVQWLNSQFFFAQERDYLVTMRTLDTEQNVWYNYNAILNRPRFHEYWVNTDYRNVVFEFFDLRRIV